MNEKEMSLQQAREFWAYLHEQAELKEQAFIATPSGSSYKDEMRTEAETYDWIIKSFAENFEQPISSVEDISNGLKATQTTAFLNYLDEELVAFKQGLENTRLKKQEALAKAQDVEYNNIKRIYKATENNKERQVIAVENARENFMVILQES